MLSKDKILRSDEIALSSNSSKLLTGSLDIGFVGYKYIWTNSRKGKSNAQERLCRYLIS